MSRVLFIFVEFNILICILIDRQKNTHMNPASPPAIQPPPQPQPAPRRSRKPLNPWVMPWILHRQEKGCYSNLLADLIHINISGYQNFVRMSPAFFDFIEEHIQHWIKKSVTNFRKPLKVELKLAMTLRHLVTGDLLLLAVSLAGWLNHHLQILPQV